MSNPRIAPVESLYSEELQRSFDVVMPPGAPPLNIFRTVGRNPRVLARMVRGGLLDRGAIDIADRELVILRACARCHAEYEWGVHVAIYAGKAGFSPAQIADTCAGAVDPALWSDTQRALIALVDALHETAAIPDELWARLQLQFSDEQLVEVVMLAGLYHAVSFVVNGFQIEHESFAPRFPESVAR